MLYVLPCGILSTTLLTADLSSISHMRDHGPGWLHEGLRVTRLADEEGRIPTHATWSRSSDLVRRTGPALTWRLLTLLVSPYPYFIFFSLVFSFRFVLFFLHRLGLQIQCQIELVVAGIFVLAYLYPSGFPREAEPAGYRDGFSRVYGYQSVGHIRPGFLLLAIETVIQILA